MFIEREREFIYFSCFFLQTAKTAKRFGQSTELSLG